METVVTRTQTARFNAPERVIGDLDADAAAELIAAAADVALVLDRDGRVLDVATVETGDIAEEVRAWIGRPWVDLVTAESRVKVEELLDQALNGTPTRWRQINHTMDDRPDLPVRYTAVRIGDGKAGVVAIGRDLRSIADIQQRLVSAQQSMEREYARLRSAETRYRLLFQVASEAVLIVDAASQRVVEANPAAMRLLGPQTAKRIAGRFLLELFDGDSAARVGDLLTAVRTASDIEHVAARLDGDNRELMVSASIFRQEGASHFLVRLHWTGNGHDPAPMDAVRDRLSKIVEKLPDGFVVTDDAGHILLANTAFLDLTQFATEEQVRGRPIDTWLGRSGVDFPAILAQLRDHGSLRGLSTLLRGEYGTNEDVVVSAVSVFDGDRTCFGFTIQPDQRALDTDNAADAPALPRSVEQFTSLVGRVPLRELVRETTDMIERLCIEAALELTSDNRASAAEVLDLSRQSLYSKLRRYGLGDLDGDADDDR